MAKIGTVEIDIKGDTTKLVAGMNRAEKSVNKAVGSMKTAILSLAGAYAGIKSVEAFKGMVEDSIATADATGKLAKQLGFTTSALSELQYAASYAAISNGELNAGLSALVRRLTNFQRSGGGAAAKAFKELGISAEYARENFTSTEIAFKEINKRLSEMPDGFRKTAIAQDIFSKSASGILKLSASDYEKFSKEAQKIGISISQSTYNMAAAYHDEMDRVEARFTGIGNKIAFELLPTLTSYATELSKIMDGTSQYNNTIKSITTMAEAIGVTVVAVKSYTAISEIATTANVAFSGAFNSLNSAIILTTISTKGLTVAQNAMPILALVSGVYMLVDALSNANDELEIQKKLIEENSKGYTGLGIMSDLKYDKMTADVARAYDEMDKREKAYQAVLKSGNEKVISYYKKLRDESKNTYSKLEKDFVSYSNKIFNTLEKTPKKKKAQLPYSFDSDVNKLFGIINQQTAQQQKEAEDAHTKAIKDSQEWIKAIQEFNGIDIGEGLNDKNKKVEATFEDWGKTLNSSISNSIVDALQSGDVMGALQGLGGSIGSSMIQASTANLVAGGKQLDAAGGLMSMGGVYGMATGLGLSFAMSQISASLNSTQVTDIKQTNFLEEISKNTQSTASSVELLLRLNGATSGVDFNNTGVSFSVANLLKQAEGKYKTDYITTSLLTPFNLGGLSANALSQTLGNLGLGGKKDKVTYSNYNKDYETVQLEFKNSLDQTKEIVNDTIANTMKEFGDFNDDILYNVLMSTNVVTKKSKDWLGITHKWKETNYSFRSITELQANVEAFLQQFGTEQDKKSEEFGKLTDDGLKAFKEAMSKAYSGFDDIGKIQAEANGKLDEYNLSTYTKNKNFLLDAITTQYKDAYSKLGLNIANISVNNIADYFNEELMRKLEGALGGSFVVDDWVNSFKQLGGVLSNISDISKKSADISKKSAESISKSLKTLDNAYLGQYSPLSMLQKTDYANNIAYSSAVTGGQTAIDDAYRALQAAAQTATRDEDITLAFNRYTSLLQDQTEDSTRTDIVNEIIKSNEKLSDVVDRLERLERAS